MSRWLAVLTILFLPWVKASQVCLSTCVNNEKPALRVIALNWSATEMLLTLGVEPVGAPQISGYKKWQTNHPKIGSNVTDIGRRQEPSLSVIAALKPDLIIGYDFRHRRILPQLNAIAPTLLYQQFPTPDDVDFNYFEQSLTVFDAIAKATHTQKKAQQVLDDLNHQLNSLSVQINYQGYITYAKFVGMGYGLRVFSQHSLAGSIAHKLGLKYQSVPSLPGKDFTHLTIEQLPKLSNTLLLLAGDQTKSDYITGSPVWSDLAFVREKQLSQVEPLWSFGGPVSISRMAHAFSKAVQAYEGDQYD
ncbi:iron-siderophore ABC transporter substrate-binding protein [Vibrio sp. SCSIO 43136]|uniref:ABC transporter substrate-binding protein n=1 Tax=Vibrio sp. SCSIO 43136 TaxID=2819101 RepID=UPI002075D958|nr:iron-siderophore ABC transporter substrate-binding protein [Vibrio sp. SCSIO 43136]USD67620.1 iron-siderophore ABC transporter substrate-binding protein [Vibrio sp. SCSIO 43136]